MTKNKIVLYGHFGSGNIGNDSSFEAAFFHAKKLRPDADLICVFNGPQEIARRFGIETLHMSGAHADEPSAGGLGSKLKRVLMRLTDEFLFWLKRPSWYRPGDLFDGRSDQFSFCVALYHAHYDEWPFAGETLDALRFALLESGEVAQPSRSAAVPAAVRKALLRGLARDPEQRFPNIEALLDALAGERHHMQRRMMVISGVALSAALGITITNMAPAPADPCEGVEAPDQHAVESAAA